MLKSVENNYEEYKASGFIIISYDEYLKLSEARKYIRDVRFKTPPQIVAAIEDGWHPLRAWRMFRNMSQNELAKRVGVDRSIISRAETGGRKMRWKTMEAFASALMIDPDQLDVVY